MNSVQFNSKIDEIRDEISRLNKSISDTDTYTLAPSKPKPSDDPEYRSYALNKFMSTYNYKTYKRREKKALQVMKSKYTTHVHKIEDMDKFVEDRIKNEFLSIKKWSSLDNWGKKNRMREYLQRKINERDDLIDISLDELCKELLKNVKSKDIKFKDGIIQDINKIDDYL